MANSYSQFTGWVSVSDILKSEPSCTSHEPRASFQRWQVGGDPVHGKCPHAATQSYVDITTGMRIEEAGPSSLSNTSPSLDRGSASAVISR